MANTKEIRTQIGSIKKTQKITGAMEMVAASKMRKTQDRMLRSRPYAERIRAVIAHLAKGHPEYEHPFLVHRDIKRVGVIVMGTDRGLCGSLNSNLFKAAVNAMKEWDEKEIEIDVCVIGQKAEHFFNRIGAHVVATATHLGDAPGVDTTVGVVKTMLDAYEDDKLDALYLASNEFINTMTQKPRLERLLPLEEANDQQLDHYWDYIYEPDAKELLDTLLKRYIESQVYQAVVENIACEQASRMVAMKSATENAGDLIEKLERIYHKARQASITSEISEIVAGAAAV